MNTNKTKKNKEIPNGLELNIHQQTISKHKGTFLINIENNQEINQQIKERFDIADLTLFTLKAEILLLKETDILCNKCLSKYKDKITNAYLFNGKIEFVLNEDHSIAKKYIVNFQNDKDNKTTNKIHNVQTNVPNEEQDNNKPNQQHNIQNNETHIIEKNSGIKTFSIFILSGAIKETDLDLYDEIEICNDNILQIGEIAMQVFSECIEI